MVGGYVQCAETMFENVQYNQIERENFNDNYEYEEIYNEKL